MTASIARMNLALHGVDDFAVARGDTLERPAFTDRDRLATFDVVLANPPYSIKQWNREAWTSDVWGRNMYGAPPQGAADLAFVQHIIASMDSVNGRSVTLLPHGFLARESETEIRSKMIEADVIDAIIGLGRNLFYNSGMESCLLVCRSKKPAKRKGKILFVDASDLVYKEKAQSYLSADHQQRITDVYVKYAQEEGFSSINTLDDVRQNKYSLGIQYYVGKKNGDDEHGKDLQSVVADFEESSKSLKIQVNELIKMLDGFTENPK